MSGPSSIQRLPAEVREALDGWLRDPAITQLEATRRANALLAEIDPDRAPVTKSSVNRYSRRMEDVGQRLRESREVADAWIGKLGSQPGGKLGQLVTETLRTVAFEASQLIISGELDAESLPGVIKQLQGLALAAQRLEKSSSDIERRDRQIREEERRLAVEAAAEAAGEEVAKRGLSKSTVDAIKLKILGVAA